MAYFPKSQVTTNLYSNQEFVILETQELYTGFYWKNSSGQFFTGKTPQDLPTQELIPKISKFCVPAQDFSGDISKLKKANLLLRINKEWQTYKKYTLI